MESIGSVGKLLVKSLNGLPTERASSNVQRAIDERMSPSEAFEHARIMAESFSNFKGGEIIINAIAEKLASLPRYIAEKCADPLRGLAQNYEFLSLKAISDWCDREIQPLYARRQREIDREDQRRFTADYERDRELRKGRRSEVVEAWLSRMPRRDSEMAAGEFCGAGGTQQPNESKTYQQAS